MNEYIVSIHLQGGGVATLRQTANSASTIEAHIRQELNENTALFRLQFPKSVIEVQRSQVIGYSIDDV